MALFERLRLLSDRLSGNAAYNMAFDEGVLSALPPEGDPVLRVYRWERPAVSFGYFEAWEPVLRAFPDREPVRRWTGGGVVLHGEDWTYSILVPRAHPFAALRPADTYRLLHEALAAALPPAGETLAFAGEEAPRVSRACFENAVRNDLLADGRKIAGAAQRRSRAGLLHQGSVLGRTLPDAFAASFAAALAREVILRPPAPEEIDRARHLAASRYGTPEWLRKR